MIANLLADGNVIGAFEATSLCLEGLSFALTEAQLAGRLQLVGEFACNPSASGIYQLGRTSIFSLAAPSAARVIMRKLQNIVSNFGNVIVRQGNVLVTIFESSRSLRALSESRWARSKSAASALYSNASSLAAGLSALGLGLDAWQWPITTGTKQPVGTAKRRHEIMCHRAAA